MTDRLLDRFFRGVIARPWQVLFFSLLLIAIAGAGLGHLVKDTSIEAFMPNGHPALVADERVEAIFDLHDPVAIAIESRNGESVFNPDIATLMTELSERIASLPNVRTDGVTSLVNESAIFGASGIVYVEPYFDVDEPGASDFDASRQNWQAMPPHIDTLVSADASAAIILAEIDQIQRADDTYLAIRDIASTYSDDDIAIHVAGPAAVSGYLSRYIDTDARKLQPLVFLVVLSFIFLAFRRLSSVPGPLLVVAGSAAGSLGLMSWLQIPYYAITNALPVIIVAIAVADSIHILSAYYRHRAAGKAVDESILVAMHDMARPITLTTVTTIAGFTGIASVSIMPPITWFAVFAAVGVLLAWLLSMTTLPALLALLKPSPSPAFARHQHLSYGWTTRLAMTGILHRGTVIAALAIAVGFAAHFAAELRIDRSQVENFAADEPIRIADGLINERFAGSAFLDVMIESSNPEGLLEPEAMQRIAELQAHFDQLPHVQKTVSIVDYLDRLHEAIDPSTATAGRDLPGQPGGIAQYLLVYEASGDPSDLEDEIDYDYQHALVRGVLDTPYFSDSRETVHALQAYVDSAFGDELTATLSGNVNVGYHWMESLKSSHFAGVGLSLLLVLVAAAVCFRSLWLGIISVVPVSFAVLCLYAVMGALGIYLEPATSMFAAIALGVGVDFAIHLVEKLQAEMRRHGSSTFVATRRALPATARACGFNSAALGVGFSVLLFSDLPTLQRFGGLIAVATLASYAAAVIFVPVLMSLRDRLQQSSVRPAAATLLLLLGVFIEPSVSHAELTARDVARQVEARNDGDSVRRVIDITLTNRRGRERQRTALVLRVEDEEARRSRITYLAPKSVRNMSFLSHDYAERSRSDARWLYLPATQKVRRIPSSDRGAQFLGTDFSYEDVKSDLKFDVDDFRFSFAEAPQPCNGRYRIIGTPIEASLAKELGYSTFEALVDAGTWMPVEIRFTDLKSRPLKQITVAGVAEIDGILTATDIIATNHQTGHETRFRYRDIDFSTTLSASLFDQKLLTRELPRELEAL
ncbi:MAG: outer membrane lipoprotein-sorting protein [Pseudomonadota bacterium]